MENLYDRVVIEFQKDEKAVVSVALSTNDLDILQNMHGQDKPVIIAMVFKEMEQSIIERSSNESSNNGVSVRSDES